MGATRESGDELRTVVAAIGVAVVGLIVGGGLVVGTGLLLGSLGFEPGIAAAVVIGLVPAQVGFVAVGVGYLRYRGVGLEWLGLRAPSVRDLVWMGTGYVLMFVAVGVGAILVTTIGAPTARNQIAEIGVENPEVLLLLVPLAFLVIGPGEEILFRGVIQNRLREAFGPVGAITIASALFAGVHFLALTGGASGRVVSIVVLFLPSVVLGVAYERTENLVVSIVIHGAYDATLFLALYAVVKAGVPVS